MWQNRFWNKGQEFSFGYVEFGLSIRTVNGDDKYITEYMSLDFGRRSELDIKSWSLCHLDDMKVSRLHITKGLSEATEEKDIKNEVLGHFNNQRWESVGGTRKGN